MLVRLIQVHIFHLLLFQICTVKFIGLTAVMMDIIPIVSQLNLFFQQTEIDVGAIKVSIIYSTVKKQKQRKKPHTHTHTSKQDSRQNGDNSKLIILFMF